MDEFIEYPVSKGSLARRKTVCGVGINDVEYKTHYHVSGKQRTCPYLVTWMNMLKRCYCALALEKEPSYKGCSVITDWLRLSNFKSWMVNQDWHNKQLDKDILEPENKVYSPTNCVFVTPALNSLLIGSPLKRIKYPQGTSRCKHTGRFRAMCSVGGVYKHIGRFDTPDEAAAAYNAVKAKEITRVAYLQTDARIREALLNHAALRLEA